MAQTPSSPILCLGVTPCLQRTLLFDRLRTGDVNRATRIIETVGGKGTNVARVLQVLGGNVRLVGVCGGDTGRRFEALLQEEGVCHSLIPSKQPTRICQTLIDEATGKVTELVEEASPLRPEEIAALRRQLTEGLQKSPWLVIAGSPPPDTAPTLYRDFIQQAHASDRRVILDTQKEPLRAALSAAPWLVKLNQQELAVTLGRNIRTPEETRDAALALIERGAHNVVVTQGPHTVWWVSRQGIRTFTPPSVQPVNPIGSGDAMAAGIALGVSRQDSLEASIRLGIACGAASVQTLTSGVVQADSVLELLARMDTTHESLGN
ncbi:1-phosphofructokinase family hexose kinase [Planctomycetota bacterium]